MMDVTDEFIELTNYQTVPADTDAERALLSAVLRDPNAFYSANLEPKAFFSSNHQSIWQAMSELAASGSLDVQMVVTRLNEMGKLTEVEAAYVRALTMRTDSLDHAEAYAAVIRDRFRRRRAIDAANRLASAANDISTQFDPGRYVADAMATAEISGRRDKTANHSAYREWFQKRLANPGRLSGMSTGFAQLDNITDGLEPGTTLLLAGEPKKGKSMLADQIGVVVAGHGYGVVIYSLEITDVLIMNRWVSALTGIPAHKIKRGDLTPELVKKVEWALGQLSARPLDIVYNPNLTTSQIRADIMRRRASGQKVDLIVIDYSALIHDSAVRGEEELDRQARVIGTIRSMCAVLGVACILVHTLNKSSYGKEEITLAEIAGRVGVGYHVDIIAALYQSPDAENPGRDDDEKKRYLTIKILAVRDQNCAGIGDIALLTRHPELPLFQPRNAVTKIF